MQNRNNCYIIVYLLRGASKNLHVLWTHRLRTVLNTSIDWNQSRGLDGTSALPTYLNSMSSIITRKSSCVNARGIPPASYIHPGCLWWGGTPILVGDSLRCHPGIPPGTRDWGTPPPKKGPGTWDWGTSTLAGIWEQRLGYPPRKDHGPWELTNKVKTWPSQLYLKGTFHVSHSKFALNKDCFRRSLSPELKANPSETGEAVDTVAKQMIFLTHVRKQAVTVQTSHRFIHNKPIGL